MLLLFNMMRAEVWNFFAGQNAALLKSLSEGAGAAKINASVKHAKANMNNILMELRK